MTLSDLSQGILREIIIEQRESATPVLQIVQIKELPKKGPTPRYKVAISDGRYWISAVCSTSMNRAIADGELKNYNVVKVTSYDVNEPNGKKVLIILGFETLSAAPTDILGSPDEVKPGLPAPVDVSMPARPAAPPAPQPAMPSAPQPRQEPKPATPARGTIPKAPTGNAPKAMPISSLSVYLTNQWTIRVKVIQKDPMKTWNNSNGSGNLFSVLLKDNEKNTIRGTFFKTDADNWYNRIEVDKVYFVTGGKVKIANKKWNSGTSEYEISFDSTTRFEEIGEAGDISSGPDYKFKKIEEIESMNPDTNVDVCVVVKSMEPAQEVSTRRGPTKRRRLQVVDDSNKLIELTLWGEEADKFPESAVDQVIAIKDARVGEYRGKQLSMSQQSIMRLAPDIPEAVSLKNWYDREGSSIEYSTLAGGGGSEYVTRTCYLSQVNENYMGTRTDQSDYFTFYGTLTDVPLGRQIYYLACPNPACKGKKVEGTDQEFICHNCGRQITEPLERYILSAKLVDFSGGCHMNSLGDDGMGKTLIGYTAHEWAQETSGMQDEKPKKELIRGKLFCDYKIKCSVRTEDYNQVSRQKFTIRSVAPIDYAEAAKFFAAELDKY